MIVYQILKKNCLNLWYQNLNDCVAKPKRLNLNGRVTKLNDRIKKINCLDLTDQI